MLKFIKAFFTGKQEPKQDPVAPYKIEAAPIIDTYQPTPEPIKSAEVVPIKTETKKGSAAPKAPVKPKKVKAVPVKQKSVEAKKEVAPKITKAPKTSKPKAPKTPKTAA